MTSQSAAWLLLSVRFAASDRPATLVEVIGTADAINHTVPTAQELTKSLSALTVAGFMSAERARFALGPLGLETMSAVDAACGSQASWHKTLSLLCEHPALQSLAVPDEWATHSYPREQEAEEAIATYLDLHKDLAAKAIEAAAGLQQVSKTQASVRSPLQRFVARVLKRSAPSGDA
jgi:hypothetical protein